MNTENLDYDYIVESFYCEYKLNVSRLKEIIQQYKLTSDPEVKETLNAEFFDLYPECPIKNISQIKPSSMPPTIIKKMYFIQSPKGANGLPSIHYSLKEKMLSDFRATRKKVKHDMEEAEHTDNKIEAIRLNAKQLAIKVVCNSEYGASNNEYFSHYDPDIAAAVTYAARKLIGFLTCNLESDRLYVDEQFIRDNQKQFNWLYNVGVISIEKYKGTDKELFNNRRHVLGRLFDDNYNVIEKNVIQINIKQSSVIYQDTDSNYYINEYIINKFIKNNDYKRLLSTNFNADVNLEDALDCTPREETFNESTLTCSPQLIDLCMHSMLYHNELLSNFTADSVKRKPIGLGFEGSFIICRYLNRKKKYYGVKWSADGTDIPLTKLPNKEAYLPDGNLIKDYLPYWIPKKTVIPQPNGEYIKMTDELLEIGVNYLDYVKKYNVKCTGVDLARRDQYKFINWFHVFILQKDLRLMKYEGDGKWNVFPKSTQMLDITDEVINTYKSIMKCYNDVVKFINVKPQIKFTIFDFAKTAAYRKEKKNTISVVVSRLKQEAEEQMEKGVSKEDSKLKYISGIGDRMSYVIIVDDNLSKLRKEGKPDTKKSERAYVVDEILDDLKSKYKQTDIENEIKMKGLDITYDEWINAKAMTMLDDKYYLECLCKSIALYIVGDLFPNEIKEIDDGMRTPAEAGGIINKLQVKIAKMYIDKFYASNKIISKNNRSYNKFEKSCRDKIPEGIDMLVSYYKISSVKQLDADFKNKAIGDIVPKIEDNNNKLDMLKVIKNLIDDNKEPSYLNNVYKNIYKKYVKNKTELERQISTRLALKVKFERVFEELNKLRFNKKGELITSE